MLAGGLSAEVQSDHLGVTSAARGHREAPGGLHIPIPPVFSITTGSGSGCLHQHQVGLLQSPLFCVLLETAKGCRGPTAKHKARNPQQNQKEADGFHQVFSYLLGAGSRKSDLLLSLLKNH